MLRLPYDWKTPTGYLMTVFLQFVWAINIIQYVGCLTFLAFGIFVFAIAFVKVMRNDLDQITMIARDRNSPEDMYKTLSDFIWTHANAKQLSVKFNS